MKSLADYLPPEFAAFVPLQWHKNETDYRAMRTQLHDHFRGSWVGIADGKVIASGPSAVEVAQKAEQLAPHPFVAYVGQENEPECVLRPRTITSLADMFPPEIKALLHPDLLKNEADYWKVRDDLLRQYEGLWVAFADGAVIASGRVPVPVGHKAKEVGRHAHVTCVGHEFDAERIRRVTFPYNPHSSPPLPMIDVEFRAVTGTPGALLNDIIPDTGADATSLPWLDCIALRLDPALGRLGTLGVMGVGRGTVVFDIWAYLDGQEYKCRLHGDLSGTERILGRDVLNQLEILFRGPAGEVIVNP